MEDQSVLLPADAVLPASRPKSVDTRLVVENGLRSSLDAFLRVERASAVAGGEESTGGGIPENVASGDSIRSSLLMGPPGISDLPHHGFIPGPGPLRGWKPGDGFSPPTGALGLD